MSDVLFVVPVFTPDISNECYGTVLLATILRKNGIDVDIYRYYESNAEEGDFAALVENSTEIILSKSPRIVSFYCRGDCYLANIRVAEKIKEKSPDTYIVFGGPQADLAAAETIKRILWVDYCCSGEGETTITPFFSGLLNNEDVSHIKGLTYRNKSGEVVSNPRPDLLSNLDELPLYDYSFIPDELKTQVKEEDVSAIIDVGRGCPYNCAFCSTSKFWQRKFRLKSPQRIVQEMEHIEKELEPHKYIFTHDLFTVNKSKVYELCKILKENGHKYKWSCSSRADTIDKELIEEMISANMKAIYLGIETGSPRMQKLTHKNLDLDKAYEIIEFLSEKGVIVTASFIYGFPEETIEDLEQTLQLVYKLFLLNVYIIQLHLCAIFPGTEYFELYKDKLVLSSNVSDQVGDIGLKENLDFVDENKELFPFYYEYHNELRTEFIDLPHVNFVLMNMYKILSQMDPQKFKNKRLVDLYLDFKKANKAAFESDNKYIFLEDEVEIIANYLSTIYEGKNLEKIKEVFKFNKDLRLLNEQKSDLSDVKIYNINIDAISKGKNLYEIELSPTMVYFSKVGEKITYVAKPLVKI